MREAVQTLIAVGLLQSHPGKGTWVREDAGAGLIHPEAVKARLGELNARSLAEARSVVEVALTELAGHPGHGGRPRPHPRRHDRDARKCGRPAGLHPGRLRVSPRHRRRGHNELLAQFYHLTRTLFSRELSSFELISLPAVSRGIQVDPGRGAEGHRHHDPHHRQAAATCSTSIRLLETLRMFQTFNIRALRPAVVQLSRGATQPRSSQNSRLQRQSNLTRWRTRLLR